MNDIKIQNELSRKYLYLRRYECFALYYDYWHREVTKFINKPKARVLECGCGTGELLLYLKEKSFSATGIDVSEKMLESVPPSVKENVSKASTQELPYGDGVFDVVICKGSLHHVKDPEKGLLEIKRVLKKDGILIISEPCRDNLLWRKIALVYTRLKSSFDDGHRNFSTTELNAFFEKTGFISEAKEPFGFFGFLFLAMPQQFSFFKLIPFAKKLASFLVLLDRKMAKIPAFEKFCWHKIFMLKK